MIDENDHVKMIVEDMLESGNFDFYRISKQKRPKGKMSGMWFSFKMTLSRSNKLEVISPEHFKVMPYDKLTNRIKNVLK